MLEVLEYLAKKMTKNAISVNENLGESPAVFSHSACCYLQRCQCLGSVTSQFLTVLMPSSNVSLPFSCSPT